jgi:hypothetical protein
MNTYLVVFLFLVGMILYIRYAKNYTKRFTHIGLCAAQAYIMYGDEDSLLAARTVCASMSTPDKKKLLYYISSAPTVGEGIDATEAKERMIKIINLIESDKNSISESTQFKKQLDERNKDWLYAVMKCDLDKANELFKSSLIKYLSIHLKKDISKNIEHQ